MGGRYCRLNTGTTTFSVKTLRAVMRAFALAAALASMMPRAGIQASVRFAILQ